VIEAYFNDDYRVSPVLTLNLGVRWEYESPITEAQGRLVNLELAPGFTSARRGGRRRPAAAGSQRHPAARQHGVASHPGLVAGGARQLRHLPQPERSTSRSRRCWRSSRRCRTTATAQTSAALPLTLATGFLQLSASPINTFAVDPAFRVGSAHNWQASVQRDLPSSLTVDRHLSRVARHAPDAAGAAEHLSDRRRNPCASCPSGSST
jgi:hypothetical protein